MVLTMPRVLCAVKALILHQGRFLMLKQELGNRFEWDFPGGRMEFGETPEEALRREVKEETGLDVTVSKSIGCYWFFRVKDGDQVICIVYSCDATLTEIDLTKNVTAEASSDFCWVTKEEVLDVEFPVSHESLKQLLSTSLYAS